jgi:DnaJ like chaperone protein
MNIFGLLAGAFLGFLLFHNPFGIFLGAFVGHMWDRTVSRLHAPAPRASRAFILPLFGLAGAIAKSDGRVSQPEIAATENLMARMQLTAELRAAAIEQFNAGKQAGFATHLAIADLKAWCGGRRDLAFLLLDMLLDIVYAEGALAADKLSLVRKLCWALGVHERELAALAAMKGYAFAQGGRGQYESAPPPRSASSAKDPYAVLGLDRNASDRDVKNAYRKLISQHHPDKLGDVPEELKRRAEQRAGEINAAYEKLREERGIK